MKWAGGKSVLVITGDLIDKGSDSLGLLRCCGSSRVTPQAVDGQVIISMGNYEGQNFWLSHRKENKGLCRGTERGRARSTDVANCNGDLGQFLCNLPMAVRVNNWFFSHGGNTKNRTIRNCLPPSKLVSIRMVLPVRS